MSRKLTAFLLAILMLPLSTMNVIADEGDPDLSINEITFSDNSPTGGDTITITAEIANDGGASGLVSVTTNVSFYWDNNFIGKDSITVPGSNTADAEIDWRAVGGTHTIKVIVDEEEQIRESDEDNNEEEEEISVAYPPILLLDDDNSANNGGYRIDTAEYYANALDNMTTTIGYDIIVIDSGEDAPDFDTLSEYSLIIWACGSDYQSGETDITFTTNDKENVADYLEGGGGLWAIGQDILYDFDSSDGDRSEGDFEYDYLGVAYADHDRTTPAVLQGVDDDPISDGIAYDADALSSDFADDINPRSGFEKIFSSGAPDDYNTSSVRTEDEFKVVFMTADFSSITNSDDRDELMELMVEYLIEQLENDVSISRFNTPTDGETVEPNVENIVNVTVRNRGTEDQDSVQVSLEIRCLNNTYRFTDSTTISLDAGEGAFVEFEWDTPDDEDYEYEIKVDAEIGNDEKEDNNEKQIGVNTYVTYDVELSDARVDPMIAEKDTNRVMSVLVTNTGDVSMNSDITGKVYDGAGGVMYNGGSQSTDDLSPGDSVTLEWQWSPDEYGTFWFEAEVQDDNDEIPENDKVTSIMRSVDIEFSDDMEEGTNGWTHYKSLSNPWHIVDTDEDGNREASSPTHSMWVGDESKGDGEYESNWDFSLYTANNHTLGTNPTMSVDIWYSTEFSWDGGNVQISTDGGQEWTVLIPDGGYPDDAVVGLDNEPGYTGTSGDQDGASWETANFNLGNYSSQDVKFKFRFGTDSSVDGYEGWYIDDFQVVNGINTLFEDDFEDGTSEWEADVVPSEWNYYSEDEEYGKSYSGDYAWYLGNTDTGYYSASLNDSLETPTIDLGDGSEKYVSAMVWFGIDGPYDYVAVEINVSGEWETLETFPGDDGDYSENYEDADDNGWLYVEADVSEYEGDASFRLRFYSNTYTQYNGLYVDDFTLFSLPPIPNDVGTKDLNAPDTAKPGREVSFTSNIYNFGTEDQGSFDVRGTITKDDGTEFYNETQEVDGLDSKDNTTLEWTWEGGPNGTYTIRVETLLDDDERAGNNPKEEAIDIAESGYKVALAVEEQAKDVLSGESVFFEFTATNTGENSGYYDVTVDYVSNQDDWYIISHTTLLYLTAGSSQNFTVAVIAPTLAPIGDEHQFSVTVTSRDDPETYDEQEISATPFYYEQSGGDKVLLIDANFGKNNGYNNYYDVDEIDVRIKDTLQDYFGEGESRGYDVYTIPYDTEAGAYGELHPYPTLDLMSNYDVAIWTQGDHNQRNLTAWKGCISDYLDNGGSMWIMGQQFISALNGSSGERVAGTFEYDYLKIEHVSNGAGTPNPLLGVDDDEIFSDAEYDMGDRSLLPYDYADWIRPNDDAVGAFYTGAANWWHIVDTEEDENRKASSPTHSMWIGDETKGNGEYRNNWDYSIYTSDSYELGIGGQLTFQHYYDTDSSTYPYDGGNVQISTDNGDSWEVIYPSGGYPADSVIGLDYEPGYYGDSNGWNQASFDLSNFSGEDVRFKFRFGADGYGDTYEGWYFDDVELTDSTSGSLFSDDMESGMGSWDDAAQIYNMSLHYAGDYRLIVSPFTFGFVNNTDDREDLVARGLDWLRAAAAADDVGVKLLEIESATEENSTIEFSSIIKNYGSEDQAAFNVQAKVTDSNGDELWTETKIVGPLESGQEETLDWEWESGNPEEVTITVETLKDDENHRNNVKDESIAVVMVCIPEITTFNDQKQGQPGDDVMFDLIVSNRASGTDTMEIEMSGSAANWGQIANEMKLESNESRDLELALKIDEDTDYGDYDLTIFVTATDGTMEQLELVVTVTDNPANYEVEIELDPTSTEVIAGKDVEFTVTIQNKGDEQDTFDLGASEDWVTFDEDEITIGAGGEAIVDGVISVPSDADNGNSYIDISATSRNDQSASDEKTIKVIVEELEYGATLRRDSEGLITISPGDSGTFDFTLLSDSNGKQSLTIVTEGSAGNWATSSLTEVDLEVGEGTTFTVTIDIPFGTDEETYRLEVAIMNGNDELDSSISNVVVQQQIEENMDVLFCLTDLSGICLSSGNFEITIEADKIQTASVGFSVENLGNVDTDIAFEVVMPDGSTGSEIYFHNGVDEWRVALSPTETELYPIALDAGDAMDWGAVAVIAREVSPGSYTFTVNLLQATEASGGSYLFERLEQVTVTVIVEGDIVEDGSSNNAEDDSLLPGPSFISVISLLAIIVYRRRK
tara:strand:+ start:1 stop:6612 length:6612 start_codon:yes stop_codon:yes gene_type:complete